MKEEIMKWKYSNSDKHVNVRSSPSEQRSVGRRREAVGAGYGDTQDQTRGQPSSHIDEHAQPASVWEDQGRYTAALRLMRDCALA